MIIVWRKKEEESISMWHLKSVGLQGALINV
jgi:hypothetical protein